VVVNRLCYCVCTAIGLVGKLLQVKLGSRYNVDQSLEHSWLQVRDDQESGIEAVVVLVLRPKILVLVSVLVSHFCSWQSIADLGRVHPVLTLNLSFVIAS